MYIYLNQTIIDFKVMAYSQVEDHLFTLNLNSFPHVISKDADNGSNVIRFKYADLSDDRIVQGHKLMFKDELHDPYVAHTHGDYGHIVTLEDSSNWLMVNHNHTYWSYTPLDYDSGVCDSVGFSGSFDSVLDAYDHLFEFNQEQNQELYK